MTTLILPSGRTINTDLVLTTAPAPETTSGVRRVEVCGPSTARVVLEGDDAAALARWIDWQGTHIYASGMREPTVELELERR
jgi:hypothetical protein